MTRDSLLTRLETLIVNHGVGSTESFAPQLFGIFHEALVGEACLSAHEICQAFAVKWEGSQQMQEQLDRAMTVLEAWDHWRYAASEMECRGLSRTAPSPRWFDNPVQGHFASRH